MAEPLWTLPVPSTALFHGVVFQKLLGRTCSLSCDYEDEDEDDKVVSLQLLFDGVEAFKCTYYRACSLEMIEAYDKLTDLGCTEWLNDVKMQLDDSGEDTSELRHLTIYFDDGPCYEFICRSFRVESKQAETGSA
jgi:hypothetical protein